MSNKQKKEKLLSHRTARTRNKAEEARMRGIQAGTTVRADPAKIASRNMMPSIPKFYYDYEFQCRDCGTIETWTAKRQKQYYEEHQGEIEGKPIRCNACRRTERDRKAEARKIHLEGMKMKKNS